MRVNRKELIKAVLAVKGFTTYKSVLACGKILIDGPGQKVIATDIQSRAEFSIGLEDYQQTVTVEPAPFPGIGEHFLKRLKDQKAADLKAVCDGEIFKNRPQFFEGATKKEDRISRIHGACQTDPELYEKVLLATGYVPDVQKQVEVEEQFLVDHGMLLKILKAEEYEAPSQIFGGDVIASALRVGSYFQRIPMEQASEFPNFEYPTDVNIAVELSGKDLGWVSIPSAQSGDSIRAHVCNIFFDHKNKRVSSTDGSRLHVLDADVTSKVDLFLSWKPLAKVAAMAKDKNVIISLDTSGDEAVIRFGSLTVYTKNETDTQYPEVEELLAESTHEITVDTAVLRKACDQAGVISKCGGFTFNGSINIEAKGEYGGKCHRQNIPVEDGKVEPEINVALNVKYILDGIKDLGKSVLMTMTDEFNVFGLKTDNRLALIMPMRAV